MAKNFKSKNLAIQLQKCVCQQQTLRCLGPSIATLKATQHVFGTECDLPTDCQGGSTQCGGCFNTRTRPAMRLPPVAGKALKRLKKDLADAVKQIDVIQKEGNKPKRKPAKKRKVAK